MRSRRLLRLLPALCLLPVLGGCLEVKAELKLEKNGQGTWQQISTVQMEKAKAYVEMIAAQTRALDAGESSTTDDPLGILDVDRRRKALDDAPGIRVSKAEASKDKAKKSARYEMAVRFDSLGALLDAEVVEDANGTLVRTSKGAWKLTIRYAFLDFGRGARTPAAQKKLLALRTALLANLAAYWGDLRVESTIVLPTPVVETNGTVDATRRRVTWVVRFADLADPEKLVRTVTFEDAKDLALKPYPAPRDANK